MRTGPTIESHAPAPTAQDAPRPLDERPLVPIVEDPHPGFLKGALHFGYDLAWGAASVLGSPWLLWKTATTPGFGRMVTERLGRGLPPPPGPADPPRILVHGVSVGEVKGAVPLVRMLERARPEVEVVVSTTTDTGTKVARELFPGHSVVRFPADISLVTRRFLQRVRPTCVVLIELEIWPNFLRDANRMGIPVAVVNGRITDRSFAQYRVFRSLLPQFDRISLFCAQGHGYASRFLELCVDPERVLVTGNLKADGLAVGAIDPGDELRRLLGGGPGQLVIVAGSTHDPEERWVVDAWRRGAPDARLVIVPRHPKRCPDIVARLAVDGSRPQRLTELRAGAEPPDPSRPALVDTIGELERVYGLADLVFVGGSLIPHGGQNMLEAAAQGRPVVFGPHVANFSQEARLLLDAGACRQVASADDLTDALRSLAAEPDRRERMADAGRRAVEAQKGAAALTLAALDRYCLAGLDVGSTAARDCGSPPGT